MDIKLQCFSCRENLGEGENHGHKTTIPRLPAENLGEGENHGHKTTIPRLPGENLGEGENHGHKTTIPRLPAENLGEGKIMDIKRQSLAYRQRTWARGKPWT